MTREDIATSGRVKYSHTVGLVAMEGRGFSNPVDLAVSSDGRIYVASRTNAAQPYGIRVGICDIDSKYFGDFGSYGPGDGQFVWPTALAVDGRDQLYMADEYNNRITVFDGDGGFLRKWDGTQDGGGGQLSGPSGIICDSQNNMYVVEHLRNRIRKVSPDGRQILTWGEEGLDDGQFNLPWGVTLDAEGNVYVADWRNDRIQKFTSEGNHLATFGEPGDGDSQFCRPSSVAVDSEGYVFVADWGNERVQILDPNGKFVQVLRGSATLSKWADEFFEANEDEKMARGESIMVPDLSAEVDSPYEASARIEQYFWGPISVKLDRLDRLYVVESNRHRIQIYVRK